MSSQFALRGIVAGIVILFVIYSFMAYLEPSVYMSALTMLTLCK